MVSYSNKQIKMLKKIPKIISQKEFEEILKHTLNSKKKNRKQLALAMLLAFEAGMRISEIVGFKGKNIIQPLQKDQVDDTSIRVLQGKGKKDRVIARPKRVNANAIKLLPLKLERRTLQRYVTYIGKDILGKHITFHTLRHGFATHYYNKTKDIRGLQQTLGHSRLDTTAIYAHTNPEETIKKIRDVF